MAEERRAKIDPVGNLVTAIERYLNRDVGDVTKLRPVSVPPVQLKGKETFETAAERVRADREKLAAELHRVRCAPIFSKDAKQRARLVIEDLAARGVPDVSGLINSEGRDQMARGAGPS